MREREEIFYEITLKHNDCWTSHTNNLYKDVLIMQNLLDKDYLDVLRLVEYKGNIKDMFKRFQRDFDFFNINIHKTEFSNKFILSMKVPYKASALSKFNDSGATILSAVVTNGFELYEIASTKSSYEKLDVALRADRTIEQLDIKQNYKEESLTIMFPAILNKMLTEKERTIVKLAIKNGFFESPRKKDLSFLAEQCDLSKKRVSVILKNAESKVFSFIID